MTEEEPKLPQGKSQLAPRDNPLVPFALMKRMYAGMVESRLLEAALSKRRGEGKRSPLEGQEACRAAVLLNLEPGDLVSDLEGAATAAWLRGAALDEAASGREPGLLPPFEDLGQRLAMAVGAAAAIKASKQSHVVVVFLGAGAKRRALRFVLRTAALHELPMLFAVLPSRGKEAPAKSISAEATRDGVPGIPVEAGDAVAICRVAQEGLLRARAGGGPALLECVRLENGKRISDPVAAMGRMLLRVGACGPAWLDGVAPAFQARLKLLKRERPSSSGRTMV